MYSGPYPLSLVPPTTFSISTLTPPGLRFCKNPEERRQTEIIGHAMGFMNLLIFYFRPGVVPGYGWEFYQDVTWAEFEKMVWEMRD
jgi:hypothetical protein